MTRESRAAGWLPAGPDPHDVFYVTMSHRDQETNPLADKSRRPCMNSPGSVTQCVALLPQDVKLYSKPYVVFGCTDDSRIEHAIVVTAASADRIEVSGLVGLAERN